MTKPKKPETTLAESGWKPDAATRKWCADRHPTVDVDKTFEEFELIFEQNGKRWSSWSATFKRYINRSIEKGWDGVKYKPGGVRPDMEHLIQEARAIGFRDPHSYESPGAYRTALRGHAAEVPSNVRHIGAAIKRM